MKFEDLTVGELKKHAKGAVKGYTAMKKDELVKHLKKGFKLMKGGNLVAKEPKGRTASGGRCWDGYEPVEGKKPYSEGSCKKVEGSGLEDSRKRLKEALQSHLQILKGIHEHHSKIRGGQLPCRVTEKMKGLEMEGSGFPSQHKPSLQHVQKKVEETVKHAAAPTPAPAPVGKGLPWEDAPNFKSQFEKHNATEKKKFKDLASFADHIMNNKDKFQAKTLKRARFFKNVLQKKKSS